MKSLGVLASHPIQYQAPIFRELAKNTRLQVYFAHRDNPQDQADAGFGIPFSWDIDPTDGYPNTFLKNNAKRPGFSRFFGCNTPDIFDIVREQKFDAFLVLGWHLLSYWQAIHACKRAGTRLLVRGDSHLDTPRPVLWSMLKKPIYRYLLGKFDACLYVGIRNKIYYQHYGVPDDRLFFSPHCVDTVWFGQKSRRCLNEKAQPKTKYGIDEAAFVLLFVGKFQSLKRPQDVIEAAEILSAQGYLVEVVMVGDGEMKTQLSQKSSQLNYRVHMLGFRNQKEMPQIYALADVVVLPSESETWGLVVNEAMSCGVPAIVSDKVGCAPDLIEPGVTGDLYPVGNVPALATAVKELLLSKNSGHDFEKPLRIKMDQYSPAVTSEGIITAIEEVAKA